MKKYLAEMIGTMVLVLMGCGQQYLWVVTQLTIRQQ